MRAVTAALGPDALTTVPAETASPDASVTPVILAPSRSIETTSPVTYSTPFCRAFLRHQSNMVAPSK